MKKVSKWVLVLGLLGIGSAMADREDRWERRREANELYPELALRLENPLARVLALPMEFGFQKGGGGGPDQYALRVSPRIPIVINEHWHLISRTEFSLVYSDGKDGESNGVGLTDVTQGFFFSPDRPVVEEVYWGIGPSMILPTATRTSLASNRFSLGPSVGVFRQRDPWTAGLIATHLWSLPGGESSRDVNGTRLEPVLAYTASTGTTIALSAEINYDWTRGDWSIPAELTLNQLTLVGGRPLKFGLGLRYWIDREGRDPDWSCLLRFTLPLDSPRWSLRR
ncbi:MAG: hypothetical protein ACPG4K_09000 [Haloferula sp.]